MNSCFARLDQAEFAAGEFLDGVRILTQTAPLLAEPGIVGAHHRQRLFKGGVPRASLHRRQQPLVADQRVNHQDSPDDQHEVLQGAPAAPAGPTRVRLSGGGVFLHSARLQSGAGLHGGVVLQAVPCDKIARFDPEYKSLVPQSRPKYKF